MNFISISDLSKKHIKSIFSMAEDIEEKREFLPLKDKTFLLFFPESSIRTRITFEIAIKQLGGEHILFPPASLDKRESLKDVAGYVDNWADGIVIRHPDIKVIRNIATNCRIPVINAMTKENHPCEILSDLYSIKKIREDYLDLNYSFVGGTGNICNSWINAGKVLGLNFTQICSKRFLNQDIIESQSNIKSSEDLGDTIAETDIVLTDSLSEEMKNDEYINNYQITVELMGKAKNNVILNPCPPFYRGEEVSSDVIDSDYFVGYEFKKSLLFIHKAIILFCLENI